jgi:GNAT superfamily N-acetyltransferase
MALTDPQIEASLASANLADAEALVREAGWNQVAADWDIFRTLGTVFTARAGNRVVATAATLPYGKFGWISMVLVAGDHRRQGLGTQLLERCVAALDEKSMVPVLDATPAGRPLYRAMGFQETWSYHRLARSGITPRRAAEPPAGIVVRAITDADWGALCAYDAAAFGAERGALLQHLRGRLPAAEWIAERNGRIGGFMLGRNGRSASQIGPLAAEDDDVAQALLARALPAIDGTIYIDVADAKSGVRDWLTDCGFSPQRPLTRMLLRRASGYDDPSRTFAVAGPELG